MSSRVLRHRASPAISAPAFTCAATGASATRSFAPAGLQPAKPADRTGVIQAAIDRAAAAGGGIVRLPAGTFVIDGHLLMKSGVKLIGRGQATVLKAGPGFLRSTGPDGGYPLITTAGAAHVTIADLTADQSGNVLDANAHQAARLSAYLVDVRDSTNVVVQGVYTRNPFTYSIAVVGSSNFCVYRCNTRVSSSGIYNELDGIHILDSNNGDVLYNYVDQRAGNDGDDGLVAHSMRAPVYRILYAGNKVRGGNFGDGMQMAVGKYPIHNIQVTDNEFWGSPYGIRTGYWATNSNGSVYDISITGNYIHDLVPGYAFPNGGNAIDVGGFGAVGPVTDINVQNNSVCAAGSIIVTGTPTNVVRHNHYCFSPAKRS